ncbi:MAG: hypothetical protein LAT75_02930 [Candidatus Cyclonatronum sp.]|uniref:hypothetical protein n=1 Tax=Cyclonatronum sp. TaxID=3024185 RepID=UPI0025BFCD83|nr:hypothetical protein [Cyclonatronum sp.]MCH8485791.1 hypothetical protein [Cyclonatronum sp.]
MMTKNLINFSLLLLLLISVSACGSKLVIQNVDFANPIEMVMPADAQANVSDTRTGLSFNLNAILEKEGITPADFESTAVRMIRNTDGLFFLTAPGFRHVFILESGQRELKESQVVSIPGERLQNPAFNQRSPLIQLVDGDRSFNLSSSGLN